MPRASPVRPSLAAARAFSAACPPTTAVPARLAAALIRLALSRRTGDLDTGGRGGGHAAALLGELPEDLLARHPGIRAQVLSARGAAELRAGRLDEAVATFKAGAPLPPLRTTGEHADGLAYLALVEALRGRLSRAVELSGRRQDDPRRQRWTDRARRPRRERRARMRCIWNVNEMRQAHGHLRLAEAALRDSPDKLISAVACLVAARRRLAEGRAQRPRR